MTTFKFAPSERVHIGHFKTAHRHELLEIYYIDHDRKHRCGAAVIVLAQSYKNGVHEYSVLNEENGLVFHVIEDVLEYFR